MKKLAILLTLASPSLYAQVQVSAAEAKLFDQNNMIYQRETHNNLDPLRSPLDQSSYIQELLEPSSREARIERRVRSLKSAGQNCPPFQNPIMTKREWLDTVNESVDLIQETFSDSLENNPSLKLAYLRDMEVMKNDPSCVNGPNDCRLKLRANLELYTSMLAPNYPKEDIKGPRGTTVVEPEVQKKMRDVYDIYNESMKVVMEGRSRGKNPGLRQVFERLSMEHYFKAGGLSTENMEKSRFYERAKLEARVYAGTLSDIQNILTQKKNRFEIKIGSIIQPRKGGEKYDPKAPSCQAFDFPNQYDFFSPNNFMSAQIPIPADKQQIIPCVEKTSLREEHKIDVNFETGLAVIKNPEVLREKALGIFEGIKARGYIVTGYQILASSSQVWGKNTPATEAKSKNIALSKERAQSGQKIVDGIPGFSELDHIPAEKLATDEGVTEVKLNKVNIEVLGPSEIPAGIEGKLADNKDKLYEALKPEFDRHNIFKTKEEYFAWLEQNKISKLTDATYKPFQFFKLVVEGRKEGTGPCAGKDAIKVKSDAKSKGSSGDNQ